MLRLAKIRAEYKVKVAMEGFENFDMLNGFNEFLLGPGAASGIIQSPTDEKHLGPGTMQGLYDLYLSGAGPAQAQASLSTWSRFCQYEHCTKRYRCVDGDCQHQRS